MKNLSAHVWLLFILIAGCSSQSLIGVVAPHNQQDVQANSVRDINAIAKLYDIATFDVYADGERVHLLVGGKLSKTDKSGVIRYLRSDDGGRTWGELVALGKNAVSTIASRGNDIQLAAQGENLLALWPVQSELPGMGYLFSLYSADGGKSWKPSGNPAINNQGDQQHADLLADQQGNFHAAWLEDPEENGYQSLRYALFDGQTKQWQKAKTLDNSTCSCCWNKFSLASDGTINLLYRDMKPRDMALLQSIDSGTSWQSMGRVGEFGWQFDGCPHVGGGLVAVDDFPSHLHSVVWTGVAGRAGLYYLGSDNKGKTWAPPHKLGKTAQHGDIAALDDKQVLAVWDELGSEGSTIFYAVSQDGGSHWEAPKQISGLDVSATHPRIVAVNQVYLVLWTEKSAKQPNQLVWKIIS